MIQSALIFIILSSAAATPPPPAKTESALVVLRVSGQPVTEKQVIQVINQLAAQQPPSVDKDEKRKTILYNDAIENLIITTLLKNQALSQNITLDKTLIDQQVQAFSKQFPSEEDFKKELALQGITELELRRDLEENMSAQKVLELAAKDVPGATEEELMKFYSDNLTKFDLPQRAIASHILLQFDSKSTPEQKAAIRKKLEGIRAEIESKTISFADAARKHSQDSVTAQKGGDLGIVVRNPNKSFDDPEQSLAKIIFTTTPGTISPVIETAQDYRIIVVKEIRPAGRGSFEEVKPAIQLSLDKVNRQKALQKYLQGLREKADIEYFMTKEEFFKRHPGK
jgi:parvulin-like peptidyl-prolyl isomerase